MAKEYTFKRAMMDIIEGDEVTGQVYFSICEDGSDLSIDDQAPFTATFPLTTASWRANAEAGIVVKHHGATPK